MSVAAFFDMDRTLLHCNTGTQWIRFLKRRGEISTWRALRAIGWIARYKLSIIDMEAVTRTVTADLAGDSEAELIEKAAHFFAEEVVGEIAPKALAAIDFHRRRGDVVAILSGSSPYVAEPLARHLGIEHVLCTRLDTEGGKFTGRHIAPACAGAGKVYWASAFALAQGVDLRASWFYTDSYSDLPMLLEVGVPKVVNPDTRLRRHARRAGWSMEEW